MTEEILSSIDELVLYLDSISYKPGIEHGPVPTWKEVQTEVAVKRVRKTVGYKSDIPEFDGNYEIYSYLNVTEYKNLWNNTNMWCRGLIFDANERTVVAVPYRKFFNVNQMPHTEVVLKTKGTPIRVAEKYDGSLGIVFYDRYQDRIQCSTKGSMDSKQAQWATEYLNNKENYENEAAFSKFHKIVKEKPLTHMFEIIYPENRIVLDYGNFRGLIYHGSMSHTGQLCFREELIPVNWKRSRFIDPTDIVTLQREGSALPGSQEGYVVTFADSTMVKIKSDEYKQIHRSASNCTSKTIFKLVRDRASDSELYDFPDEFHGSISEFKKEVQRRYDEVVDNIRAIVAIATETCSNKKEYAMWAQKYFEDDKHRLSIFFSLLNSRKPSKRRQKPYTNQTVWKLVQYDDLRITFKFSTRNPLQAQ